MTFRVTALGSPTPRSFLRNENETHCHHVSVLTQSSISEAILEVAFGGETQRGEETGGERSGQVMPVGGGDAERREAVGTYQGKQGWSEVRGG